MKQYKCQRCLSSNFWKTSDGRLKCKNCRYIFTPKPNPFKIQNELIEEVVSEFLLEHSTNLILERIEISKYKLLKLLNLLRKLMAKDLPFFEGKENQFENKDLVLGIGFQEGKVFAQVIPDLKSPEIERKYQGLVFKNSFHRLKREGGRRIDVLEGFWGYLKRKLSAKGGIRKERLPFYLAEYSWRYNHRKLSFKEQKNYLLKILFDYFNQNSNFV